MLLRCQVLHMLLLSNQCIRPHHQERGHWGLRQIVKLLQMVFCLAVIWQVLFCVGEDNEPLPGPILHIRWDNLLSQKWFLIQGINLVHMGLIQRGGVVIPFLFFVFYAEDTAEGLCYWAVGVHFFGMLISHQISLQWFILRGFIWQVSEFCGVNTGWAPILAGFNLFHVTSFIYNSPGFLWGGYIMAGP